MLDFVAVWRVKITLVTTRDWDILHVKEQYKQNLN